LNLQQNCRENHKSSYLRVLVFEFLDITVVLFPNSFICMNVDSCNLSFDPSLKFWLLYTVSDNLTIIGLHHTSYVITIFYLTLTTLNRISVS